MQHDIRKAVNELKSAGMGEFLHQDPAQFDYDEDCYSKKSCQCPKTKCTRVKKYTFFTRVTRVKKCKFVTKRIRVKKCKLITKCIRYDKKCYWTRKCVCKKTVTFPQCNQQSVNSLNHYDTPLDYNE
ncbi:CotG/ExsB N-terminal domain-containing protein [Bacillus bombysepticus]